MRLLPKRQSEYAGRRTPLVVFVLYLYAATVAAQSSELPGSAAVDVVLPVVEKRQETLRLVGTVEAIQHAQLTSEQAGRIEAIAVEAGDQVTKGQLLLQLDDSLAKLSAAETASRVDAASVALAEAKRLLAEVEALQQRKVVAATLVDERRAQLAAATATLAQEKATLAFRQRVVEKHSLRAPFAGLVEHRAVSVGEWLGLQSVAFRLVSNDALRVRVHIPQEYYFALQRGAKDNSSPNVTITHDQLPQAITGLKINRLVAVSQQSTRAMPALIDLPTGSALAPGMAADVIIELSATNHQVWVPLGAVKLHPDGGSSVIAVIDDRATRINVDITERDASRALVAGLQADIPIVASGVELIRDGMALSINSTGSTQP